MRMRHIVIRDLPNTKLIFLYNLINGTSSQNKGAEREIYVLILCITFFFSEIFLILRRIERDRSKNVYWPFVRSLSHLSGFKVLYGLWFRA